MALIKCPECGKEISDQAAQCIHCGYPLPAVQVEEIRPERYVSVGAGQKAQRRAWAILLVVLLAVAVTVGAFMLSGPRIELPYGLKPGMSVGELRRQMEDHGFVYTREQQYAGYRVLYFDSCYVRGYQADFVTLTIENDSRIEVGVFYEDARAYGLQNPGTCFHALREQLLAEYGKPDTDFSGVVAWESGDYRLMLSYMDNSGGELWINYSYRPEK